ncbi:MAG: Mut7-C RNAse domain-containing protein [Conexivisphaerales archaeon]
MIYNVKFLVDAMLGTLAKKLRIYGFDTLYAKDMNDSELIELAISESRILVTSDRVLGKKCSSKGGSCVVAVGRDDTERIAEVFRFISVNPVLDPSNSRCPICNGALVEVDGSKIDEVIPKATAKRYNRFFMCEECKKVYWEGSHWAKLREFDRRVRGYLG